MMRRTTGAATAGIAAAALALAALPTATPVWAQDKPAAGATTPPLIKTTFTKDEAGWKTLGDKTKVATTDGGEGDKKALRFDYEVAKGQFGALYLLVADNEISTAKSVRFSVKADKNTTLACLLQEKEGGRYIAAFHAPGGKWQNVALAPSDFRLAEDANDPEDPNDKLDMERIESISLVDLSQYFAQSGDDMLNDLFGITTGPRSFLLGEFTVGRDALPAAALPFVADTDSRLDTFRHPQVGWMSLGRDVDVTFSSEKPLTGRGLKLSYDRAKAKLAAVLRSIPPGWMEGREKITCTLASEKPATVIIQVEEKGGGKYNTVVYVPSGATAQEVAVAFTDFKPADDSKDKNNKLDLYEVHQVLFLDITALVDPTQTQAPPAKPDADPAAKPATVNTLWIGDIKATKGG